MPNINATLSSGQVEILMTLIDTRQAFLKDRLDERQRTEEEFEMIRNHLEDLARLKVTLRA